MGRPRKNPGEGVNISVKETPRGFRARARLYDAAGALHTPEATARTAEIATGKVEAKIREIWGTSVFEISGESTFEQVARDFLESMELRPLEGSRSLRKSSREKYQRTVTKLIDRFGALSLDAMKPRYLYRQLELIRADSGQAAMEDAAKGLSLVLSHASFIEAIPANPMSEVSKRLPKQAQKKMALTPFQFAEMIRLVRSWRGSNPERSGGARPDTQMVEDYLILGLALSARPAEVFALSLDVVSIEGESYRVAITGKIEAVEAVDSQGRPVLTRTGKRKLEWRRVERLKGTKQERTILLADFAVPTLRRLIANYEPNDDRLLFLNRLGGAYGPGAISRRIRAFRSQFEKELKVLGIEDPEELVPYAMRKTAATTVVAGPGLGVASKLLGHAHQQQTDGYATHLPEVPEAATRALSAAFWVPEQ